MEYISRIIKILIFLVSMYAVIIKSNKLKGCSIFSKERIKDADKWFKWGQLYSFCMETYLRTPKNDTKCDKDCKSSRYNECIYVCDIISVLNETEKSKILEHCEKDCRTDYCKKGCRFYDQVFRATSNSSLDESKLPSASAIDIKHKPNNENVTFEWKPVESIGDKKISSVYLITIRANVDGKKEYILGLSNTPVYTATNKDMCNHVYYRYKNNSDSLKFALKVYPINLNGPSNLKDSNERKLNFSSKFTKPITVPAVQHLHVAKNSPFYVAENTIVWKMEWNKTTTNERSRGVRFKYGLESCETESAKGEILNLNMLTFDEDYQDTPSQGQCSVKVVNTPKDLLKNCKIKTNVVVKYGGCFLSEVKSQIITYSGCETVKDYKNPCHVSKPKYVNTSLPKKDINVDVGYSCQRNHTKFCPNTAVPWYCIYCVKSVAYVNVTWDPHKIEPTIWNYTIRWGIPDTIFALRNATEKVLPANSTSFIIEKLLTHNERVKLGVQIHANTNHSIMSWHYDAPVISFELTSPEPIPMAPVPNPKSPTSTIIIAVVLVSLALIGGIFILKVYRYRLEKQQGNNSNTFDPVLMTPERVIISDDWEINPQHIKVIEQIGEGGFGTVYSATVNTNALVKSRFAKQCGGASLFGDKTKAAVKLLKEGARDEEVTDFYDEISLMKDIGYHKNIVNMIGCCTTSKPLCLVVEFMYHGNLLDYLRNERVKCVNKQRSEPNNELTICHDDIVSFAWQIASGMEYLTSKNIVHRDLAARNILVGHNNLVKISDFGLSRRLSEEPVYLGVSKTRKLPVKWMSIEAIFHKEFTAASDVWSYGVVLFEIVTLGGAPYPFIGYRELCKLLKSGYRLEKPENCPDEMYDTMCHCWNAIPAQRPTFTELREHLEKIIERGDKYFSFEIDDSKAYYNVASFKSIPSEDENDDPFLKDYDQTPIQVKPLCTVVKPVDVAVDLVYDSKLNLDRIPDEKDKTRYISPTSIQCVTDLEKVGSFDNPNFHFIE